VPWVLLALLPVEAVIIWRVIITSRDVNKGVGEVKAAVDRQGEEMRKALLNAVSVGMAALQVSMKEGDDDAD
jgi:hypothetical protein